MTQAATRKGASRAADIPPDVLAALERGELQSATLGECLALDQVALLRAVFPDLGVSLLAEAEAIRPLGIVRRMAGIGALLLGRCGVDGVARCAAHPSDTVRGWACFMLGTQGRLDLPARLAAIAPLADDAHFGVREWAWMAVRPHVAGDPAQAIGLLADWTSSPSARLRRFASEVTRPRGVWCAHVAALKRSPELALPILEPLRADRAAYVQDSVANWLNDAGKGQPDWVRALCRRWQQEDPSDATRRICSRAQRNLV